MMHRFRKLVCGLIFAVLTTAAVVAASSRAEADVIYNWVNTGDGCCSGQISVTDYAYFKGYVSFNGTDYSSSHPIPFGEINYMSFNVYGYSFTFGPTTWFGAQTIDLSFVDDGLIGRWLSFDTVNGMAISSNFDGTIQNWKVNSLNGTDVGLANAWGRWVRAGPPPIFVPEPASGLLLLGGLGWVALRRKREAKTPR